MNKEFETIQDRVKHILEISETSRNSDSSVVANYWWLYQRDKIICTEETPTKAVIPVWNYCLLTQPSVIERARRLIQFEIYKMPDATDKERELKLEAMKAYYPTDPKIIKRRRLSSKLWKDYINNKQINNLVGES